MAITLVGNYQVTFVADFVWEPFGVGPYGVLEKEITNKAGLRLPNQWSLITAGRGAMEKEGPHFSSCIIKSECHNSYLNVFWGVSAGLFSA